MLGVLLLQQMSSSCDQVCGKGVKGDTQANRTKVNLCNLIGQNEPLPL